jgi:hypothetical protein
MLEHDLSATTIGALKTEVREYPFPAVPPDGGILRMDVATRSVGGQGAPGSVQVTVLPWN